jgi:hypothetical protein
MIYVDEKFAGGGIVPHILALGASGWIVVPLFSRMYRMLRFTSPGFHFAIRGSVIIVVK